MPSDRWKQRVEQLGLGFRFDVRELDVPTLEGVVELGAAGERCDDLNPTGAGRAGAGARSGRKETKCECGCK